MCKDWSVDLETICAPVIHASNKVLCVANVSMCDVMELTRNVKTMAGVSAKYLRVKFMFIPLFVSYLHTVGASSSVTKIDMKGDQECRK